MYTLNINSQIFAFTQPQVMAIVNLTPDSFYHSCGQDMTNTLQTIETAIDHGAKIVDIGAYSSRPNAINITAEEEWNRLKNPLKEIRHHFPNIILSLDTFRADVARKAVEEFGIQIINDISAGEGDPHMYQTIAKLHVPYIMMHMQGTPQTMQQCTQYDNMMQHIVHYFQAKVDTLHKMGIKDIILDPGFGFAKTTEQNFELLQKLHYLHIFNHPILVGISRKSMIYRTINTTPQEALNGTTALHMLALQQGASILRTHDVKPAIEAIKLYESYNHKTIKEHGISNRL